MNAAPRRLSRVEHATLKAIAAGRFRYVGPYRVLVRMLERAGLVVVQGSARDNATVRLTHAGWAAAAAASAAEAAEIGGCGDG
jgi:hypothetical protein